MNAAQILILISIVTALAGCACKPLVQIKTVEVPKYVRTQFDPALTAPTQYAEPDPACTEMRDGVAHRVYCNGQLADMRLHYRAALDKANADKQAIRDADTKAAGQ